MVNDQVSREAVNPCLVLYTGIINYLFFRKPTEN